jgi:hypothetical protein
MVAFGGMYGCFFLDGRTSSRPFASFALLKCIIRSVAFKVHATLWQGLVKILPSHGRAGAFSWQTEN